MDNTVNQQIYLINLPPEIILEIAKHMRPNALVSLSSTCKEYKDLLDKEVKFYKWINGLINDKYFRVYIVSNPILSYVYYIYIRKTECINVVVKKSMYVEETSERIELDESKEMSFDMFFILCL
jgi:hypothetical protein